jgi:hypothetical protein
LFFVMPGLGPGIHDLDERQENVDGHPGPASPARAQAQVKPGHDENREETAAVGQETLALRSCALLQGYDSERREPGLSS